MTSGSIIWRKGPHDDLVDICAYVREPDVGRGPAAERVYAMSALVEKMLQSRDADARLAAAKTLLLQRGNCGLAQVVVAREGSLSLEAAQEMLNLASQALADEYARHAEVPSADDDDDDPYIMIDDPSVMLLADQARLLASGGKFTEALARMEEAFEAVSEFDEPLLWWDEEELVLLAASIAIRAGDPVAALCYLDRTPTADPRWFALRALAVFRGQQDCPAARALLSQLLERDGVLAEALQGQLNGLPDDEINRLHEIMTDVMPAWQATDGAVTWLREFVATSVRYSGKSDGFRFKRWQGDYDLALLHIERENNREARRLLGTALREAEKIGIDSQPFSLTLRELAEYAGAGWGDKGEFERSLDRYAAECDKQLADSGAKEFSVLKLLADCYREIERWDKSEQLYERAVTIANAALKANDPQLTLDQLERLYYDRGYALGKEKRFAEAEASLREGMRIGLQYLPEKHPFFIAYMDHLSRCEFQLGKLDESRATRGKMAELGANPNGDAHARHGDDCSWHIPNFIAAVT